MNEISDLDVAFLSNDIFLVQVQYEPFLLLSVCLLAAFQGYQETGQGMNILSEKSSYQDD